MRWNADQDAQLMKHWDEGTSCAAIARIIGGTITRCAVIGRAHRLHLTTRDPAQATRVYNKARATPAKELYTPPKEVIPEPEAIGTFGDAGCKWPVGQPMELLSCGQSRRQGYPYCEHHCARAFAKSYNATA